MEGSMGGSNGLFAYGIFLLMWYRNSWRNNQETVRNNQEGSQTEGVCGRVYVGNGGRGGGLGFLFTAPNLNWNS